MRKIKKNRSREKPQAKTMQKEVIPTIIKLFNESFGTQYTEKLSNEAIDKLLKDIDISSAVNKIERAVAGRMLIPSTENATFQDKVTEIEKRFSNLKFNRILNHLITARYYGYSCFEIVYNQDFTLQSLVPIPYKYIIYKDKKWKLKVGSNEIELNREKFLLSIHKWNPAEPEGKSIFEPCNITFLDKERYTKQLRRIAEKYGDIITVYPFDANMEEKEAKELGEKVASLQGGDVTGVPIFDREFDLGKVFDYIKLSDLDPEIYTRLESREKEKLIQNILGSTLTMEAGSKEGKGTNALGKVHQDGFEEVVEEVCNFVIDSLYQLIEIDAAFFGYNPQDFSWKLEKVTTEAEELEVENKKETNQGLKLDNVSKLSGAGYDLTPEYLGQYLGIDPKYLVKKAPAPTPLFPFKEFSENEDDKLFRTVEMAAIYETYLKKKIDEFSVSIAEQIREQIKKIKEGEEFRFNFDYSILEDDLILSAIKGYSNSYSSTFNEVLEEFDPFKMKFEEAIKSFMDKTPVLYETIEQVTEEIRANFVWLKKSTDLEVTTRIFDNLKRNLENGGTFKDWLADSEEILNKCGLGEKGYYLENVYRTNMATQYSIGNYKQQMDVIKDFPYWEYKTIADNRRSIICTRLDGKIYRYDDPFWSIYYPPNHFKCRSTVISRSKEEMKRLGLKLSKEDENLELDVGTFKGNPAKVYWENIKNSAKEKEGNLQLWK